MNRRNLTAAAIAATIAAAVFFGGGGSQPAALADALKPFKEAKSFSCAMIPLRGGKPTDGGKKKFEIMLSWAAPGSLRSEIFADGKPQSTHIAPHGKPGVVLDHQRKTYIPTEGKPGHQEAALLKLINGLATYSAGDQKPVGSDEIDGVKAPRFDLSVDDPTAKGVTWRYRVWVHPETRRPMRVEFALQAGEDPTAMDVNAIRLEKFEWNVKADKLFDTASPAGYESAGK